MDSLSLRTVLIGDFCSNQCLVQFMADQKPYVEKPAEIKSISVTRYPDGDYEYAMGLYYLVGSNILGHMGKETLPYRIKSAAEATAQEQGARSLSENSNFIQNRGISEK
ncbi:MAG: nitrous oxide reductase accessory protein NosL [Thermodesulfobacteriota bacterium]|nr:nitrous oxide reductase accessory protein NosL [Thermodesulfobacteriota bacterium]